MEMTSAFANDSLLGTLNPRAPRGRRPRFTSVAQTLFFAVAAVLSVLGAGSGCAHAPSESKAASYPEYPRPGIAEGQRPGPKRDAPRTPNAERAQGPSPPSSPLRDEYQNAKTLRTLRGKATYYGDSLAGHKTANGERYDPNLFTAAHKTLRFGSVVRVTRRDSGKTTYVKVNDRGPFGARDRIIDLSKAAARELEMLRAGVVEVTVEVVAEPKEK